MAKLWPPRAARLGRRGTFGDNSLNPGLPSRDAPHRESGPSGEIVDQDGPAGVPLRLLPGGERLGGAALAPAAQGCASLGPAPAVGPGAIPQDPVQSQQAALHRNAPLDGVPEGDPGRAVSRRLERTAGIRGASVALRRQGAAIVRKAPLGAGGSGALRPPRISP